MDNPPNIIFIMTDQQRADTIAAAGNEWMITPALDRLAREGVLFGNAFCCGAACVASRAAMFTGMYAHNTGVYSNKRRWAHHRTWLDDFREAGYTVVNVGKMHARDAPMAFHDRYIVENKSSHLRYDQWNRFLWMSGLDVPRRHMTIDNWARQLNSAAWPYEERYHSDVFVGDMALNYIERWDGRAPLLLQIGFPGPHEPYDPLPRVLDMYQDRAASGQAMPSRIYQPGELARKPPVQAMFKRTYETADHEHRIDFSAATDADLARMRRHYCAGVTGIDEKVGQILDALQDKGMLQTSIVVFTSDHGDNLGDHDLPYKWFMYDSVTRVPLIVRLPAGTGGGRMDEGLFSHIDLGPTLLELAGLPVPSRMDGCSRVARLASSPDAPVDDAPQAVYAEENYLTMARTATHKLVYYAGHPWGELYDLVRDPDEVVNLYDVDAYRPVRRELEAVLLEWLARSSYENLGYKTRAGATYDVSWLD
jgi:arylsulfatase A-like enzyme